MRGVRTGRGDGGRGRMEEAGGTDGWGRRGARMGGERRAAWRSKGGAWAYHPHAHEKRAIHGTPTAGVPQEIARPTRNQFDVPRTPKVHISQTLLAELGEFVKREMLLETGQKQD